MFLPGIPTSRSIVWDTYGRHFRLTRAGEQLILDCSDGRLSLHFHEWQGVAAALAMLHPAEAVRSASGAADGPAPRGRRAWMESEDAELVRGWYGGEGLAVLAARLGRSADAVAGRLVRLDLVNDRAQARLRP